MSRARFPAATLAGVVWLALPGPGSANCGLLLRMADVTDQVDPLLASIGTEAAPRALQRFGEDFVSARPEMVARVVASGDLQRYEDPLTAYSEALQSLLHAAADDEGQGVAASKSYQLKVGADLVARLVEEYDCRSEEKVAANGFHQQEDPKEPQRKRGGGNKASDVADAAKKMSWSEVRDAAATAVSGFGLIGLLVGALGIAPHIYSYIRKIRWRARRDARHACRYKTTIRHAGTRYPGLIIDISEFGCQVTSNPVFARGDSVSVQVAEDTLTAQVMWRSEDFVGLRFESGLTKAQFLTILPEIKAPDGAPAAPAG